MRSDHETDSEWTSLLSLQLPPTCEEHHQSDVLVKNTAKKSSPSQSVGQVKAGKREGNAEEDQV